MPGKEGLDTPDVVERPYIADGGVVRPPADAHDSGRLCLMFHHHEWLPSESP